MNTQPDALIAAMESHGFKLEPVRNPQRLAYRVHHFSEGPLASALHNAGFEAPGGGAEVVARPDGYWFSNGDWEGRIFEAYPGIMVMEF